ncbi:response regulator transcription factor [Vibrio sp. SA48]|uniref:response regulator n=1 Tax=Vibrio sp. S12_S33 TaxID=2720223 RepID=UPI00178239DD|nr:response regulator transcription factor [Vibrio sp. S12_S33]MBD1566505.1 response regulator transcription factor [Vibrio sp. S12_S33]
MKNVPILIIDDDQQICELLVDTLSEYGYSVLTANDGQSALKIIKEQTNIGLIFLDLILPDSNGLSLLQHIRSTTDYPVIMLSGLGSESDVIVGLEMGADDYIPKPFRPRIVVARAKAVMRRANHSAGASPSSHRQGLKFNGWLLDTQNYRLYDPNDNEIPVTQGEYTLLYSLLSNHRKVLSRQQLLDLTHSDTLEIYDRTIDVLIMRLRKKIELNPKQPELIRTIRGVGYVFACNVLQDTTLV